MYSVLISGALGGVWLLSAHSIADDSREEHKLSTPLSERPRQLGRAVFHSEGGEEEEEDDEEEEGGRGDREATQREENESVVQLREMLKTEREQKVRCGMCRCG